MKLFVTGGAGFIGSNFIRYWLEKYNADEILNYDLLTYSGNLENLRDVEARFAERYRFVRGDIGNYQLARHIFETWRPDVVVNFAAESHNSYAITNPGIFFETNVVGTQRLLQAALDAGVPRFHHISTCEVYGDLALDSDRKFKEGDPFHARTPYNAAKAGSDLAVRAYYETFNLPITISNCSNNYGPYQFPEKVIPYFTVRLIEGQPMPLYRNSLNRREWLHVLDHCRAIDLILKEGRIGETYHVGSGLELDVEEIANRLLTIFGLDDSYKLYVPDRPGHDRRYLLDTTKIQSELGWQPQEDFESGFADTVQWYRDNESWWRPLLGRSPVKEEAWNTAANK